MPPRKGKKPVKTPAVVYDWMGDPGLAQLSEEQLNFLYENGNSAPLIIHQLRAKGTITIPNPSEAGLSSSMGSSIPAPTAHDNDDSDWDAAVSQIETSILGKRSQPPSPGPAASLHTDSPARMQVNPPSPPAPIVPVVNWDNYFNNLENALSALRIDHEHTPRYLGTMLTGLQTLLRDERVLSLNVDGGFTIADMLDALPRSSSKATPTPTLVPGIGSSKPVPKPHVKRVRINPPLPPAPPKLSAPAKADRAPVALDKWPPPSEAPTVSRFAPKRSSRRQRKFTTHGPSRKGLVITAPLAVGLLAVHFTPEIVNDLNHKLAKDLKIKDLLITAAFDQNGSVFLDTTRVPTTSEMAFVLKHVRARISTPEGEKPIITTPQYSMSYLKIVDIPISDPKDKDWIKTTTATLESSMVASPIGSALRDVLAHVPRIMRCSLHSDSCIAWVDINDSVTGTSAKKFLGKYINISGINCRIAGAKPHSGSVLCTRCYRWGHHHSQCRREGVRCPLCGGPHREDSHASMVAADKVATRHCVNCTSSKREKRDHSALNRQQCPFWTHCFNRDWLKKQFPARS